MSLEVRYLNGGYCRHLQASIDGRTLKVTRFYAVFLALRHPTLGWIVCDTGYGDRFFDATRRWPFRLYRWATPVTPRGTAAAALAGIGVRPDDVRHLLLTHFHADHIGGLAEFRHAQVYYHEDALRPLLKQTPFRQTRAAFLPDLVPSDLAARSTRISSAAFSDQPELPFPAYDIFGDGAVKFVALPGHAPGQVGLEYTGQGVKTLYCADAYWRTMQIDKAIDLPRPVRALQWDPVAYTDTIAKLRVLAHQKTHRLLACHDDETQQYVTA